ncbi:hypothetical protein DH2020_035121 [Rehmannia glutinosa]|uniref:CCHC-type domain-containing protein n=1 Tax=Rehmannia glutinosa TaxID=99300 RepID=A0ABR0V827_REHGL
MAQPRGVAWNTVTTEGNIAGTRGDGASAGNQLASQPGDPFMLINSDHPGTVLVTSPLTALPSRTNVDANPVVRRPNPPNPGWTRGKGFQRISKEEKAKLVCDHCGNSGHGINECFKLHG